MVGCFMFVVVVFIFVAIVLGQANAKQIDAQWAAAATELKLNFIPGGLTQTRRIEGTLRGRWVTIDTVTRSSGKHSKSYTRYSVAFPTPIGLGMRLTRQGLLSPVLTFFGAQDIQTGDPEFDKDIVIKARDQRGILDFLTRERRERIRGLLTTVGECVIDDEKIQQVDQGVQKDPQLLVGNIRRLVRVVNFLIAEEDHSEPQPSVVEATLMPEPAHVPRAVVIPTNPPRLAQPVSYAPVAAPPPVMPVMPEEPPPVFMPEAPPTALPPEAAPQLTLTADAVCRDLFDPRNMSFQVVALFEERYKNQQVHWTGTLRRVSSFASDLVFGNEPGVKATLDIYQSEGGLMGTSSVQAVVRFPPTTDAALQRRLNGPLTFAGRLTGCDGFTRNLYVAEGVVEA